MSRRSRLVRVLALFWAALQVASPGLTAIADGQLARANSSRPATHVEATTTAACPVVHAPDCGVCRFLSGTAVRAEPATLGTRRAAESVKPRAETRCARSASIALPDGRAPPVL